MPGSISREVQRAVAEGLHDGAAALDACRSKMPDVILLDWQMPHMTGIEFLRTLRRQNQGTNPVVVFCTTENDVGHITEALNAGANEYIMKPFDRETLEAKLMQVGLL